MNKKESEEPRADSKESLGRKGVEEGTATRWGNCGLCLHQERTKGWKVKRLVLTRTAVSATKRDTYYPVALWRDAGEATWEVAPGNPGMEVGFREMGPTVQSILARACESLRRAPTATKSQRLTGCLGMPERGER